MYSQGQPPPYMGFGPGQTPYGINQEPPKVVFWYKVYAGVLTALYVLVALLGAGLAAFMQSADRLPPGMDVVEMTFLGVIYGVLGLVFAIVFAIGLFVPRKPWGWIYAIILICIGFMSVCTLPASIFLLIWWIKPETKAHFGRT